MSAFLTVLDAHLADDNAADGRGIWILDQALVYQSDVARCTIAVPAGFVTDFASVPRVPIAFLLAGDTASKPACVHDYLYATGALPRDVADAVLREAALIDGVPSWRAAILWAGVRAFGASHFKDVA